MIRDSLTGKLKSIRRKNPKDPIILLELILWYYSKLKYLFKCSIKNYKSSVQIWITQMQPVSAYKSTAELLCPTKYEVRFQRNKLQGEGWEGTYATARGVLRCKGLTSIMGSRTYKGK